MLERVNVVAAIIRRAGQILITQRFDKAHLGGMWEFPGGKVEAAETLEARFNGKSGKNSD